MADIRLAFPSGPNAIEERVDIYRIPWAGSLVTFDNSITRVIGSVLECCVN